MFVSDSVVIIDCEILNIPASEVNTGEIRFEML